ncbi:uncharacterized protein [Chironomus tepperi]|uniref:uncharacterized protein isoform X1 n=1 Tax=Chironomus tepperi TaxID=113505 RepID=UPI00391F2513
MHTCLKLILLIATIYQRRSVNGLAISPPSWSDPNVNPCARMSNGWQHLYYSPLKGCFKIFTLGFPCPETMELSPIKNGMTGYGECSCPPGTVQLNNNSSSPCYKIFDRGPCDEGHYVNPITNDKNFKTSQRYGECKKLKSCPPNQLFYPEKNECHDALTQGPCLNGKLLYTDENSIPKCMCSSKGALAKFYNRETKTCHKHFSKGNCPIGSLFLPTQSCGCESSLVQYHNETNQCYELGSSGPCPNHGFEFTLNSQNERYATCQCKSGYVKMQDGLCYRKWTKGPCVDGEVVSNENECIKNPCEKNFLYFPQEQTCYRIGSKGPCSPQQVVVFDFTVKVSLDGVSHNGMCGCSGIIKTLDQSCLKEDDSPKSMCESPFVEFKGGCFKLYSRGPCGNGQWLERDKDHKGPGSIKCQCKPGYMPFDNLETEYGVSGCLGPTVMIARFLNGNRTYKFGFQKNGIT